MGSVGNNDGEAEVLGSGARVMVSVRNCVTCTGRIMLWLDLGSRFKVRVSVKLSFKVMVRCGKVDLDVEGSGSRGKIMVRVIFLVRCMGTIQLWLELGSRYNVIGRARLIFGVMVRCK